MKHVSAVEQLVAVGVLVARSNVWGFNLKPYGWSVDGRGVK